MDRPVSYNGLPLTWDEAGFVPLSVLESVSDELARNAARLMDLQAMFLITSAPLSWEERLTLAIERRSIRGRLRRRTERVRYVRREAVYRLRHAYLALRGEWCDE